LGVDYGGWRGMDKTGYYGLNARKLGKFRGLEIGPW